MTYLHCSNNNRASTVLRCFEEAVSTYSVPSWVRCDYGVENVDVARFMLETRGTGRSSIITFPLSVHNQRVERLWRDVKRIVQTVQHFLSSELQWYHFLSETCIYVPLILCQWYLFPQTGITGIVGWTSVIEVRSITINHICTVEGRFSSAYRYVQ